MDAGTGYNNWRDMEEQCLCESRALKLEMGHGSCAMPSIRYDDVLHLYDIYTLVVVIFHPDMNQYMVSDRPRSDFVPYVQVPLGGRTLQEALDPETSLREDLIRI